jgi:hypothetical protein
MYEIWDEALFFWDNLQELGMNMDGSLPSFTPPASPQTLYNRYIKPWQTIRTRSSR